MIIPATIKGIRDQIVAVLSTPVGLVYPTAAEARVYASRGIPVEAQRLKLGPVLSVWSGKATDTPRCPGSRIYKRSLDLIITGALNGPAAGDEIADRVSDLDGEIREALLHGTWARQWRSVESVESDGGQDAPGAATGHLEMTIRVAYDVEYTPTVGTLAHHLDIDTTEQDHDLKTEQTIDLA